MRRRIWNHVYDAFRNQRPTRFACALRKYGPDSFEWLVVSSHDNGQEALLEEQRLIQALQPAYNSTPGGEGFIYRPMSVKNRERVRELHKGNKYRLGKTHSAETRERLREVGQRDRKAWLLRSHLGPEASSRRVVCLNDGLIFESASAAARYYRLSRTAVIEVCNRNARRRTAGGKVFRYADDNKIEPSAEVDLLVNGPRRHGKNPYAGVYRHVSEGKDTGRWRARIKYCGKNWSLGIFHTAEAAKAAHDAARRNIEEGLAPHG